MYKPHRPDITNHDDAFVNNERMWVTIQSNSSKTALCAIYLGCQYSDDRHGNFNDSILRVVQEEAHALRRQGFRVLFLGDFNAHVGNALGVGVPGNNGDVNKNGRRFLNFLHQTDSVHLYGASRMSGKLDTQVASGLWTWQRSGNRSVIDYAVISKEHQHTVHCTLYAY